VSTGQPVAVSTIRVEPLAPGRQHLKKTQGWVNLGQGNFVYEMFAMERVSSDDVLQAPD
jgi:hypothetical protein